MFVGNTTLEKLTLNQYNYLTNSGLKAHQGVLGAWINVTADDPDWWGTTSNLVNRYPEGFGGVGNDSTNNIGKQTYIWQTEHVGGRFPSNDAAWWRYFVGETEYKGTTYPAGTLLLGVDNVETSTTKSIDVTETGPYMPWKEVLGAGSIVHVATSMQTGSRLHPTSLASWFENSDGYYTGLVDVDLSNLLVDANTTSFEKLFYKSPVVSVNISGGSVANVQTASPWQMSESANRTNMFGEANSLVELTLGMGNIITNTGIEDIVKRRMNATDVDNVAARWRIEELDGHHAFRDFKIGDYYVTLGNDNDPGIVTLYGKNSTSFEGNSNTWGVIRWHWYPGTIVRFHNNKESLPSGLNITGNMADAFVPYDFEWAIPNPSDQSGDGSTTDGFQLENYRLIWWNTLASPTKNNPGHEFKAGEKIMPTATHPVFGHEYTDLYAQWAPIRYSTLQFVANDAHGGAADINGDAGDDVVIPDYNEGLSDTDHYYMLGYDIAGWYTQPSLDLPGTRYNAGDIYRLRWDDVPDMGIDVDVREVVDDYGKVTYRAFQTLYAIWEPHGGFVLNYNLGGGSPAVEDRTDILWTDTDLLPAITPVRDGYEFLGWYYVFNDAGDRAEATSETPFHTIARDIDDNTKVPTLYAMWKPGKIEITYEADGNGTVSSTTTSDDGKTASEIGRPRHRRDRSPRHQGCHRHACSRATTLTAGPTPSIAPWLAAMFSTPTPSLASSTITAPSIRPPSPRTSLPTPTRSSTTRTAALAPLPMIAPPMASTCSSLSAAPSTASSAMAIASLVGTPRPMGTGTQYGPGARVNDFEGSNGSIITLYAQWAELQTTIVFTAAPVAGGVEPVTDTIPDGMTDVSWRGDVATDNLIELVDSQGKVVASWTRTQLGWTLSIMRVSGAATAAAAALRGYQFVEWIDASTGKVVSTDARFTPTRADGVTTWPATLSFIATFRPNTFNIAFDVNADTGKNAPADITATYGTQLRLPTTAGNSQTGTPAMTRPGYKFVGWNTVADGSGDTFLDAELLLGAAINKLVDGVDPIQDATITLFAQWEPLKYLVSFRPGADDATGSMDDLQLTYGVSGKLPANVLARPGYDFKGWATTPNAAAAEYDDEATVFNLVDDGRTFTLFAVWSARLYNVNFNTSDASHGNVSSGAPVQVYYGQHLTGAQVPAVTPTAPYEFSHWTYVIQLPDGGTITGIAKSPTEVTILGITTFTAQWKNDPGLQHPLLPGRSRCLPRYLR